MVQKATGWLMHALTMHAEVHKIQFLHLVIFSYILAEDYTQKNFSHTIKTQERESQCQTRVTVHLYKGLLAVTRLCSCSTATLISLLSLNKDELSHKPATANEASVGKLALSALRADSSHQNKTPGLVITSGPDLLSGKHLPVLSELPELGQTT